MSTILQLLVAIMGPVFFLFIVIAVSSFGSMEELTTNGKVIFKRFVLVSLWVAVLTITVAAAFFPVFGKGTTGIDAPAIEGLLLGLLPTNLVSPFTEGNIPQVVLLALVFGMALLMMGDSGAPVREALVKIKGWIMGVMALMMKAMPLVPFISTMMIPAVAVGQRT